MTCDHLDRDGSYVLGALAPAERLEFEQHLTGCADCARSVRELAGLPGLLARVDPSVLDDPPDDPPVPVTLLPTLLLAVRRSRQRRLLLTAGAAAATLAAAVVLPLTLTGGNEGRTRSAQPPAGATSPALTVSRAMAPVGDVPVRARLAVTSVAWGTRLDLSCTYGAEAGRYRLPRSVTYGLFVRTRDGSTEQVGTWRSLEGRTMRLSAATATPRRDIASVEVRTAKGRPVLELAT
jgi:anti-sigma factor RsiW